MPLIPRYCSQCGAPVTERIVDDRQRQVCSACQTVFYRNPLPVASAVVLSEERQVLLVKRRNEPKRGMWCLPIGFAELHETIAEAALRELHEETGIGGEILHLLDASSTPSDFYGDLLVVTFEVRKTVGTECPGDDAEEVAYFPLEDLPELAFSSNAAALERCRRLHADEWAIQDSFARFDETPGPGMLSDALVRLIQQRAAQITTAWLAEVRAHPTTPSYHAADLAVLRERALWALGQFGRWLRGEDRSGEVRTFYQELGRERAAEGVPLPELLSSLMLLRKQIVRAARARNIWSPTLEVYRVLELDRRLVLFFDRAMFHTTTGYLDGAVHR